jgi:hypothetical protein
VVPWAFLFPVNYLLVIYGLLFLLVQKKEQEKDTRLSRPPLADDLRFSLLSGRKKTRFTQTVFTSCSSTSFDAQRERMGNKT